MSFFSAQFCNCCHVSIPRTRHHLAAPPSRIVVYDVTQVSQALFDSAAPEDATVDVVVRYEPDDGTVDLTFAVPQSGKVWLYDGG